MSIIVAFIEYVKRLLIVIRILKLLFDFGY